MNYKDEVKAFIRKNFVINNENADFSDDLNYFQSGFVNSLFAMRLVNFIEQTFGIEIENDELALENFSTVNNLMRLINKKMV